MIEAQRVEIPCERKPGRVHSFFALKFHDGDEDREKVEAIEAALNKAGIDITLMARDVEKWGEAEIPEGKTLMRDFAFPAMLQCDCNIIEFSEKGVGLGMNAGFCYAAGKPVYIIAKTGSDISTTMANVAEEVFFYDSPEDLVEPFKKVVQKFPRVILASSSQFRKLQLAEAGIPFEAITSNADETPDDSKTYEEQLADIAMRKAHVVFGSTKDRGLRLILAADQNIVFDSKMYGKPKNIEEARNLLEEMSGSDEVYSYTGNAILLADGEKVLKTINVTDKTRLSIDVLNEKELNDYLADERCMSACGALIVDGNPFVHVVDGRLSTARGMTLELANELLTKFIKKLPS